LLLDTLAAGCKDWESDELVGLAARLVLQQREAGWMGQK
jgi:hypothetical protein